LTTGKYSSLGKTKRSIILRTLLLMALTASLGDPAVNADETSPLSVTEEAGPLDETHPEPCPNQNEMVPPERRPHKVEPGANELTTAVSGFEAAPVEGAEEGGPDLLLITMFLGFAGAVIALLVAQKGVMRGEGGEKDEEEACLEARKELESAMGDAQDRFDAAKPRWQAYARTVGRLMAEWDTMAALMAHWTGAEEELYETAERAQKVAGFVRSASSKASKALREGGEAAIREMGEDVAKEVASSLLGEVSETVGALLGLGDWAMGEIGTGIARGLAGVDPGGHAIRLRERSELICTALKSWVSRSEARDSGRQPPDTLQICIEDMQEILGSVDDAVEDFEEAVAGFRSVECEMPENILEEMDRLRRDLDGLIGAFGDLVDQVEHRLNQARSLYDRRDLYPPSGYGWVQRSREHSEHIDRVLSESRGSRRPPEADEPS